MKIIAALILSLFVVSAVAQSDSECKRHAYECKGKPTTTISQMTLEELKALQDANDAVSAANKHAMDVFRSIVQAHGGYYQEHEEFTTSGQRLTDGIERRGDWLILTKRWEPEL